MASLNLIRHLILDMDGVLWRGRTPMPGLGQFFDTLRSVRINFVLATNNATMTPDMYVSKLAGFGVPVKPSQIITSATATASYLKRNYPPASSVYVIGGAGIVAALSEAGFALVTDDSDGMTPDLVVVGLDRAISYEKLCLASLHVSHGARFVGTNPDPSFPSERGELPGAGAIQAAISATTGVSPINVGKPGRIMFEEALERLQAKLEDTAMVGDRLTTDIDGAHAMGMRSILVLSGVTGDAELAVALHQPDHVFADISALGAALAAARRERETP